MFYENNKALCRVWSARAIIRILEQEKGYEDFLAFLTNSYLVIFCREECRKGIIYELEDLVHTNVCLNNQNDTLYVLGFK